MSPLKRALDIALSASALAFIAPLLGSIALAIKLFDPGPVFFRQDRIGRGGRLFTILKFRTMVVNAEERLAALIEHDPVAAREWAEFGKIRHDPRITPLGAFLRRTSLDEIPQLWNILIGDMSLVGPRPWLVGQPDNDWTVETRAAYCSIRPGLTGLWQISGRSETGNLERIRLDTRYARNWTLAGDLKIMVDTVPAVLASRGAY